LLSFLSAAAIGEAATPTSVVYPTGSYPLDVHNVQAALDQCGTVLLKATNEVGAPTSFNFGAPPDAGFVDFHCDAELTGERLPGAETVIEGGSYPVGVPGEAFTVAVRNITFEAPFDGALFLFGPTAVEVTGNHVSHATGRLRAGRTVAEVIVVGFAGRVLIEDNIVDDVIADLGFGISQFRATGPVDIRRNTIRRTGYAAIESSFNIDGLTGAQATVTITDNWLRPGDAPTGFGAGIEINGEGAYYVARNSILIESRFGLGIYALGAPEFGIAAMTRPVIEKNKVLMRPRTDLGPVFGDGIDLVGVVSLAYVGQNSVRGEAFSALGAYNVTPAGSDLAFNTYVGNEIASFSAIVADVFLDTASHDTVFTGVSGTVIDLGSNNRIAGLTNSGEGATGQQLREAIRLRNEAMQAAIDALRHHGAMP
jgi:hypothetical protein